MAKSTTYRVADSAWSQDPHKSGRKEHGGPVLVNLFLVIVPSTTKGMFKIAVQGYENALSFSTQYDL